MPEGPRANNYGGDGALTEEDYAQRLAMGQDVIESSGIRFLRVVFPAAPRHPLRANLPLLTKAAQRLDLWPTSELVQSVESTLEHGAATMNELCTTLSLAPSLIPVLLVSGVLSARLGQEAINGAMKVAPAYGDLEHLALLSGVAR